MNFYKNFIYRAPIFSTKDPEETIHDFLINQDGLVGTYNDLHKEVQKLKVDPKVNFTLQKFINRTKYRPTPFFKWSGIGVGTWSGLPKENEVTNKESLLSTIHTTIDFRIAYIIFRRLSKKATVVKHLVFNLNPTLYFYEKGYRYIEKSLGDTDFKFLTSYFERNEFVDVIIDAFSEKKQLTFIEIKDLFPEYSEEDVMSFLIEELLLSNILISDLDFSIHHTNYISAVIDKLTDINNKCEMVELKKVLDTINSLQELIKHINKNVSYQDYNKVLELLKEIDINNVKSGALKIDTFFINNLIEDSSIQELLVKGGNFLRNTASDLLADNGLDDFKSTFLRRYNEEEFVPILEVLDTENGIGYNGLKNHVTNTILENLEGGKLDLEVPSIKINDFSKELLKAINSKSSYNFTRTFETALPFRGTGSCLFELTENDEVYIRAISIGNGTKYITRFGYLNKDVNGLIEEIQSDENQLVSDSDFVFAEIDFIPEVRAMNVVNSQHYRPYVLKVISKQGSSKKEVFLNDLLVGVYHDQVVLYSKSIKKFIIPRFTNAYASDRNQTAIFQFLSAIGEAYFEREYTFDWNNLDLTQEFTPRITLHEKVILSPKKWTIKEPSRLKLFQSLLIQEDIDLLEKEFNLPGIIKLVSGDNYLVFNLKRVEDRALLLYEIRKLSTIQLEEYFKPKHSYNLSKPYKMEYLALFNNDLDKRIDTYLPSYINIEQNVQKEYLPSSEWLSYHIYCGPKSSLLLFHKTLKRFLSTYQVSKWFFIRYTDPDYHIRFRVNIKDVEIRNNFTRDILGAFETLLQQKVILKVNQETYRREIERYSPQCIDVIESYFCYNSENILDFYDLNATLNDEETLLKGMEICNDLYEMVSYDFSSREGISNRAFEYYFEENNLAKESTIQLDKFYRNKIAKQFQHRIKNTEKSIPNDFVIELNSKLQLVSSQYKESIIISMNHMTCNRLFLSSPRTMEGIVYYFLYKYYKSEIARRKYQEDEICK